MARRGGTPNGEWTAIRYRQGGFFYLRLVMNIFHCGAGQAIHFAVQSGTVGILVSEGSVMTAESTCDMLSPTLEGGNRNGQALAQAL